MSQVKVSAADGFRSLIRREKLSLYPASRVVFRIAGIEFHGRAALVSPNLSGGL